MATILRQFAESPHHPPPTTTILLFIPLRGHKLSIQIIVMLPFFRRQHLSSNSPSRGSESPNSFRLSGIGRSSSTSRSPESTPAQIKRRPWTRGTSSSSPPSSNSSTVPLETVRLFLLQKLNPIDLANELLTANEARLVTILNTDDSFYPKQSWTRLKSIQSRTYSLLDCAMLGLIQSASHAPKISQIFSRKIFIILQSMSWSCARS